MVQLSHPHMTTGKTIALTIRNSVSKVMSLLFNKLSSFVKAFLPMSKCLKFVAVVTVCSDSGTQENRLSLFHHEVMGPDALIFVILNVKFKASFFTPLSPSSTGSLVSLYSLPLEWYHLHTWSCWCFSQQTGFQFVSHPAQHFSWFTLQRS